MTDDTPTTPSSPPPRERSWEPETGWPDAAPAPTWAEVEALQDTSDEPGLEAWLDAQDDAATGSATEDRSEAPSGVMPAAEAAVEAGPDTTADDAAHDDAAHDPTADAPEADEGEGHAGGAADAGEEAGDAADEGPAGVREPDGDHDGGVPDRDPRSEPAPGSEAGSEAGADAGAAAAALTSAAPFSPVPAEAVMPSEQDHPLEPADTVAPPDAEEPEPAPTAVPGDEEGESALPAVPAQRSGTRVVALMALLVVLLAGLTGFLAERSVSTRGGGGVEDARHDALQAARNAARVVFSYDYRHLDKDFAAGKAVSTGAFGEQYGSTTPKLVEVAKTYKAVVIADVSDAAVIAATKDRVQVLVFVNQQSTSTLAAAPKITQSRLTMTLVERGGRWLLSDVHAF